METLRPFPAPRMRGTSVQHPARYVLWPLMLFMLLLFCAPPARAQEDTTTLSPPLSDPLSPSVSVETPTAGFSSEVFSGAGSLTITPQRAGVSDPTSSLLENSLRSPYVNANVNGDPNQVFAPNVMVESPRASMAEVYSGSRAAFQPAFSGTLLAGFRGTGTSGISGFGSVQSARLSRNPDEERAFGRGAALQEFATTGVRDSSSSGLSGPANSGALEPGTVGGGFGDSESGGAATGAGLLAGSADPLSVYTDPTARANSPANSSVVTSVGTIPGQTAILQPGRLLPLFSGDAYAGPGGFPDSTRGTAGSPPEFGGEQPTPLVSLRGLADSPFQNLSTTGSFLRPSLLRPLPSRPLPTRSAAHDPNARPRTPAERRARMEAILSGTPRNPRIPRFEQEREERLRGIHNRPGERQPTVTLSTSTLIHNNQ